MDSEPCKNVICFYHRSDNDGRCSAAIVYNHYKFNSKSESLQMVGMEYNEPIPSHVVMHEGARIYVVDFSFPTEIMLELNSKYDLIWIDHHTTAIEELKTTLENTYTDTTKSATLLTWEYFNGVSRLIPLFIHYVNDHDMWDHSDPDTLLFNYGSMLQDTSPESEFWAYLIQNAFEETQWLRTTIQEGKSIEKFLSINNKNYVKEASYTIKFEGIDFLVVNRGLCGSKIFDSLTETYPNHSFMVYYYKPSIGAFRVSLYTERNDIDLSTIAKRYGGGGHRKACGFTTRYVINGVPTNTPPT